MKCTAFRRERNNNGLIWENSKWRREGIAGRAWLCGYADRGGFRKKDQGGRFWSEREEDSDVSGRHRSYQWGGGRGNKTYDCGVYGGCVEAAGGEVPYRGGSDAGQQGSYAGSDTGGGGQPYSGPESDERIRGGIWIHGLSGCDRGDLCADPGAGVGA